MIFKLTVFYLLKQIKFSVWKTKTLKKCWKNGEKYWKSQGISSLWKSGNHDEVVCILSDSLNRNFSLFLSQIWADDTSVAINLLTRVTGIGWVSALPLPSHPLWASSPPSANIGINWVLNLIIRFKG